MAGSIERVRIRSSDPLKGLRLFGVRGSGQSLFLFLEQLWIWLTRHRLHPGFDIRTYMGKDLQTVIALEHEHLDAFDEAK